MGSGGSKPFIAGQLPAITATAGQLFTDVIPRSVIADPDGDILAFSLSSEDGKLPEWLHFDPNLMTVSGVPDKEQQLRLKVTGRDKDGHSASTPLQLQVKEGVLANLLPGLIDEYSFASLLVAKMFDSLLASGNKTYSLL